MIGKNKETVECVYCYKEIEAGSPVKKNTRKSGVTETWHPECYKQYSHYMITEGF